MRRQGRPIRDIEARSLRLLEGDSFSSFTQSSIHCCKQLWPHRRARPRTLRDANAAGSSFGEIGYALIKIHVPPFDAAHHLLLWSNRTGWARLCTNLAGRAELVRAKMNGCGGNERHVGGYPCEPHAGAEAGTDERPMFAEFAEPRRNCRWNEQQRASHRTGIRISVIALRTDPVCQGIRRTCTPGILIAHIADAYTIGLVGRDLAQELVVMSESKDDNPRVIDRVALEYIEWIHDGDPDVVCFVREGEALGRFSELLS